MVVNFPRRDFYCFVENPNVPTIVVFKYKVLFKIQKIKKLCTSRREEEEEGEDRRLGRIPRKVVLRYDEF